MRKRERQVTRRESQAWLVVLCVGVGALGLLLVARVLLSGDDAEERAARRAAAWGELEAASLAVEGLAGSLAFNETRAGLEAFPKKHAACAGDPEFRAKIEGLLRGIEEKQREVHEKDWSLMWAALKAGNHAGARKAAERIRSYGSASQRDGAEQALLRIDRESASARARHDLEAAATQAQALARQRKFSEAVEIVRRFSADRPALAADRELDGLVQEAIAAVGRVKETAFVEDWEKLRAAAAARDLAACRAIEEGIAGYGSVEQIRQAREAVEEVAAAAAKAGPAARPAAAKAVESAPVEPADVEPQGEGPVVERRPDRRPAGGPEIEDLDLTRDEVQDYLSRVRRAWRVDLTMPSADVKGEVAVIPDALGYALATRALELLGQGKAAGEVLKTLRGYARAQGKSLAGKPMLELALHCAPGYGLFFQKKEPELREYFVVKYNDAKVSRTVLEQSQKPVWESWTLYTRDRNEIPRFTHALWLFQGDLTAVMQLNQAWKNEKMAVQFSGVWGLNKFRPGDMDWPGWNPERRIIQRYKRVPIDFKSSEAMLYGSEKAGKTVAPPAALKAIMDIESVGPASPARGVEGRRGSAGQAGASPRR